MSFIVSLLNLYFSVRLGIVGPLLLHDHNFVEFICNPFILLTNHHKLYKGNFSFPLEGLQTNHLLIYVFLIEHAKVQNCVQNCIVTLVKLLCDLNHGYLRSLHTSLLSSLLTTPWVNREMNWRKFYETHLRQHSLEVLRKCWSFLFYNSKGWPE